MPTDAETSHQSTSTGSAETVRDALGAASRRFQAAGCDTPRLDAELLLAEVIGADRAALFREPERMLGAEELDAFEALVRRRESRSRWATSSGAKPSATSRC